jgi:arylsulfatase
MEFAYDGGGLGKGAGITLYVDGAKVGEGRVGAHTRLSCSRWTNDGCRQRSGRTGFRGLRPDEQCLQRDDPLVQIDIDDAAADADHMMGAEERYRLAMARQ